MATICKPEELQNFQRKTIIKLARLQLKASNRRKPLFVIEGGSLKVHLI